MGCSLSCRSSSKISNVRVVHLNGYVEDFNQPVSVSQVIGKPPKHFVCTAAQLLSTSSKPLKPDTQLQPGHIYFLLPLSTFQADVSPLEMVAVVKKLTKIAKSAQCQAKSPSASPMWDSQAISPDRVMAFGVQRSHGARSWTPFLDTIREMSFHRRSHDSEIQEMHLEIA